MDANKLVYLVLRQWNGRGAEIPYGIFSSLEKAQEAVPTKQQNPWWQGALNTEWRCVTYHVDETRTIDDEAFRYNMHWLIKEMPLQGLAE
jgi:hypothetical protein